MKRFLVFCGEDYYPGGGFQDYVGSADTMNDAMALIIKDKTVNQSEWSDIVDSTTEETILPINYAALGLDWSKP